MATRTVVLNYLRRIGYEQLAPLVERVDQGRVTLADACGQNHRLTLTRHLLARCEGVKGVHIASDGPGYAAVLAG